MTDTIKMNLIDKVGKSFLSLVKVHGLSIFSLGLIPYNIIVLYFQSTTPVSSKQTLICQFRSEPNEEMF